MTFNVELMYLIGIMFAIAVGLFALWRGWGVRSNTLRGELQCVAEQLQAENLRLHATADFLLAQNVALSKVTDILHDEVASLKNEVSRLRRELGDAQALLRNLQPRP